MVALLKMPNRISAAEHTDRRNFQRTENSARVEGHRMDHSVAARREPKLTLHLRDISMGGLSALSPAPLQQGEQVTVVFPRQGLVGGWDATGRVLRCEPSAMGYRVAMEFDRLPAA
jgi:hypothetical protein